MGGGKSKEEGQGGGRRSREEEGGGTGRRGRQEGGPEPCPGTSVSVGSVDSSSKPEHLQRDLMLPPGRWCQSLTEPLASRPRRRPGNQRRGCWCWRVPQRNGGALMLGSLPRLPRACPRPAAAAVTPRAAPTQPRAQAPGGLLSKQQSTPALPLFLPRAATGWGVFVSSVPREEAGRLPFPSSCTRARIPRSLRTNSLK